MGINIGRGMELRQGVSNQDVLSANQEKPKGDDEFVQKMRDKLGTEFTGDPRRSTGKKKNELGKDDFMKLMSAQLKYQDPITPMKNEQMAAQLAQFSALEQMMNLNASVEKLAAGQKPSEHMISASLIGKRVTTDTTHFILEKGTNPEISFELPADAASVNLAVVSAKGEVVRELDLGELKRGPQSVRWDGKNGKMQEQPLGEYSYRLSAADANGKAIPMSSDSSGLVTGVSFEGGKSVLLVDGKKIPIERVGRIEADSERSAGAKAVPPAGGAAEAGAKIPAGEASGEQQKSFTLAAGAATLPQVAKKSLRADAGAAKMESAAEAPAGDDGGRGADPVEPLWNPASN